VCPKCCPFTDDDDTATIVVTALTQSLYKSKSRSLKSRKLLDPRGYSLELLRLSQNFSPFKGDLRNVKDRQKADASDFNKGNRRRACSQDVNGY